MGSQGVPLEMLTRVAQNAPLLSSSSVTGPSLTSSTSIIARKTPSATREAGRAHPGDEAAVQVLREPRAAPRPRSSDGARGGSRRTG